MNEPELAEVLAEGAEVCADHEKCCRYLLCAHPRCCGYYGKTLATPPGKGGSS